MMAVKPDLEEFEESYRSARMYHHRAQQFLSGGQHFSVVFNVASVALENYLIALCYLHGVDPGNHNYTCLMDAVETVIEVPLELNQEIRSLDFIFGICSLENYYHGTPELSDSTRVLSMCDQIQKLIDPTKRG
ncbi:hypothetical protein Sgly_2847 [Syntrophobotulus glycolicus DSM 8271]|uniref:HEPN domain protein n=1 Tax=Syntrophobotulus glycolicus (strain DSM 8271 / FlGlyR) TaxID=645991 RepID=F0SYK5_SYNGF|nr:hypothetical protein [Syntrophobotulus glycolicus]ADY57117.1 hypothetical protein Sgly_2847 [Syntrophobotulus glycolicus DSM 8271]